MEIDNSQGARSPGRLPPGALTVGVCHAHIVSVSAAFFPAALRNTRNPCRNDATYAIGVGHRCEDYRLRVQARW